MKKFILLASALLLVSCTEKISGTFNATKDVALRGKNGLVNVESGVHQATLKLRTKKKMTLVLNVNGRTEKLEFSVPKGLRIPTDHGQLRLTSQEVGQPYDMSATANTSVSRSEPRNTVESCSISVMRPVCRDVRAPSRTECHTDHYGRQICRTIPGGYRRVCTNEYVTLYGHRQITYQFRGETTEYDFKLYSPATAEEVGAFKGYNYDADRVVTYRGPCEVRPYFPTPVHY